MLSTPTRCRSHSFWRETPVVRNQISGDRIFQRPMTRLAHGSRRLAENIGTDLGSNPQTIEKCDGPELALTACGSWRSNVLVDAMLVAWTRRLARSVIPPATAAVFVLPPRDARLGARPA